MVCLITVQIEVRREREEGSVGMETTSTVNLAKEK